MQSVSRWWLLNACGRRPDFSRKLSGAHTVSYSMGTWSKTTRTWNWQLISVSCRLTGEWRYTYIPHIPPLCLQGQLHLHLHLHIYLYLDLLYSPIGTQSFNPLKPELNPICYLLALLGAHHFLHVSRITVKLLTLRWLMSYIYGAPILDVSRSHTTTQHSR